MTFSKSMLGLVIVGLIYNINKVNSDCPDLELKCPHGDKITVGQCYDGVLGCEICEHYQLRDEIKNKCYLPSNCDRRAWLERATDGCSGGPWTGGDFLDVCDMHDLCYAAGVNQGTCDGQFFDNIIEATGDPVAATAMVAFVSGKDYSHLVNWGRWNCDGGTLVDRMAATSVRDEDGDGDTDPLIKVSFCQNDINSCDLYGESDYLSNTINPNWELFQVAASPDKNWKYIKFDIYDHDDLSGNDHLGDVSINGGDIPCGVKWWKQSINGGGSLDFRTNKRCAPVISITRMAATSIRDEDGDGDTDPLIKVSFCLNDINSCDIKGESHYLSNTINPNWAGFEVVESWSQNWKYIKFDIWDHDDLSPNDHLGDASINGDDIPCGVKWWRRSIFGGGWLDVKTEKRC